MTTANTKEMIERAIAAAKGDADIRAMAGRGAGVFHALPSIVRVALRAALAGYTVIEPTTTNVDADCTVTATVDLELWGKGDGRPQLAAYDTGDGPVVDLGPVYFEIRHARSVAAAIVAVADRLASESSGGDPYPRFYRWHDSHFYRVDAPDRVWFRTDERSEWVPSGARTEASLLNAETATIVRYFPVESSGGETHG